VRATDEDDTIVVVGLLVLERSRSRARTLLRVRVTPRARKEWIETARAMGADKKEKIGYVWCSVCNRV